MSKAQTAIRNHLKKHGIPKAHLSRIRKRGERRMPRRKEPICDRDCFHCRFPDCINDGMEAEDYAQARELDRELTKTQEQKKKAAYWRAYYKANQEKLAARQRAYREANREKVAAYWRAYYKANREKLAAQQRAYRKANREKVAAYQRAYREANREKRESV